MLNFMFLVLSKQRNVRNQPKFVAIRSIFKVSNFSKQYSAVFCARTRNTQIQDIKNQYKCVYGVDVFLCETVRWYCVCPVVRRNNLCLIIRYPREHACTRCGENGSRCSKMFYEITYCAIKSERESRAGRQHDQK